MKLQRRPSAIINNVYLNFKSLNILYYKLNKCQISRFIELLYDRTTSTVLFNGTMGDWLRAMSRVSKVVDCPQFCLTSSLEKIMADAHKDTEKSPNVDLLVALMSKKKKERMRTDLVERQDK